MFLSVFDVFKIGIGPSSSHTMGPMVAASRFLTTLRNSPFREQSAKVGVALYGSLAFTGKGHATDRAVALGLLGYMPSDQALDEAEQLLTELRKTKVLQLQDLPSLTFDPDTDIVFDRGAPLPGHANGLTFVSCDEKDNRLLSETYYSIGGGFVVSAAEQKAYQAGHSANEADWPYPFANAAAMLAMARLSGLSIAEMKRRNELAVRSSDELGQGLERIWKVMNGCIERGLAQEGELPGGLRVRRRARKIHQQLLAERQRNLSQPHISSDWLSVYAMAVNEENACSMAGNEQPQQTAQRESFQQYFDITSTIAPAQTPVRFRNFSSQRRQSAA